MATIEQVELALVMWERNKTHGEIKKMTGLSDEEEFAVTNVAYPAKMTTEDILPKLANLKSDMKSSDIVAVMA